MELNLSERLIALRKAKGLTQEQLAAQLGVSAPAVSKWETGSSYPDITLLCPLARALDTNVDTLLQFEEQLSTEALNAHISAVMETCRTQGAQKAEAQLNALLHRYPNSIPLQFNAAMAYTAFYFYEPTADKTHWDARKQALLTRVYAHKESPYWQTAAVELAGMALQADDLTTAEQLLSELPEQVVEPTATRVLLYQKQGKPGLALATLQKRLYALVQQMQICLAAMTAPALTPDPHQALEICKGYALMDETFGLGGLHHGLMLDTLLTLGDIDAAADCLTRYVSAVTAKVSIPNPVFFSPALPPQRRPAMGKELQQILLLGLEEAKYEDLLKHPKAQAALEQLKGNV